jgi:hypothetical protein
LLLVQHWAWLPRKEVSLLDQWYINLVLSVTTKIGVGPLCMTDPWLESSVAKFQIPYSCLSSEFCWLDLVTFNPDGLCRQLLGQRDTVGGT